MGSGPEGQPVVDGHHDGVLEELGEDHQGHHEEAAGGEVLPTHLPRDLGPAVGGGGLVIVLLLLFFLLCWGMGGG